MGFPNGHILIIMGIQCVNPRGHNDLTSDALCKGTIPKCVKTEGFYADFLMRLFVGFGVNLTQKNASHGLFAGICFNLGYVLIQKFDTPRPVHFRGMLGATASQNILFHGTICDDPCNVCWFVKLHS